MQETECSSTFPLINRNITLFVKYIGVVGKIFYLKISFFKGKKGERKQERKREKRERRGKEEGQEKIEEKNKKIKEE